MFYQVGNQQFKNKFSAARYAAENNYDLHFNLYESAFDRADWSKEPGLSWDTLLDIRANQLARKNKPLVLHFSGGTDSLTIYEVFKRNNIHLDIVLMKTRETEPEANKKVLELFHAGLYDPTTKLIVRPEDPDMYRNAYSDPDWIWTKGLRYQFSLLCGDTESEDFLEKELGTRDFISIIGFEKPRLHFTDDGVFSYQEDENYVRPLHESTLDCFFISPDLPELHIKQSYMLLNYIKSINPMAKSTGELKMFSDIHRANEFHWYDYSFKGCGRFGDLNLSHTQHFGNMAQKLLIPKTGKFESNTFQGRGNEWFTSLLDDQSVKNYAHGIMSVANDLAGKYLMTDPNNFYSMKQFRSKYYQLTF